MGEDFALFEPLARKADDVAVAGRAVQAILPIENDVLGTFDLIESDRLRADEPIVLRVGRSARV